MALYQYIKFHLTTCYISEICSGQFFYLNIRKGSDSVNTRDRVMVLALCNSPHDPLSVYHVSFNSLVYCQRYAPDKLFMAKK